MSSLNVRAYARKQSGRWLVIQLILYTCLTYSASAGSPSGNVVAWGAPGFAQPIPTQVSSKVVAIAGGSVWSLALTSEGTVFGWGKNYEGEATGVPLRNINAVTNAYVTVNGALLNNVVAIAAGGYYGNDYGHSLALLADGTVVPWGEPYGGLLAVPADVTNVVAIAAGSGHNVALRMDGTVRAWGPNFDGSVSGVSTLSNIVAIAAGARFTLALDRDGSVVGLGNNLLSQTTIPAGLSNVIAIAAGESHALALTTQGFVVSWGSQTNVPPGLSNVIAIAASGSESGNHSLALRKDGSVVAWGPNDRGQTNVPAGLGNVVAIAAGSKHSLAITAPLQLHFVGHDNKMLSLGFRTFFGQEYQVHYTSDFRAPDWAPLQVGTVVGTGYDVVLEDTYPVAYANQRFYRLVRTR